MLRTITLIAALLAQTGTALAAPQSVEATPIAGAPSGSHAFTIRYGSVGVDGRPDRVTGVLVVPDSPAPQGGWPVVAWAHGTTGIEDRTCARIGRDYARRSPPRGAGRASSARFSRSSRRARSAFRCSKTPGGCCRCAPRRSTRRSPMKRLRFAVGRPTFGALVDAVPASRETALAVVWRLIARGRISVDPTAAITPATTVWVS